MNIRFKPNNVIALLIAVILILTGVMLGIINNQSSNDKQGDIIVAGRNFGCGSSREHAPIALGAAGIQAVVAESYARIFFRNAVATGELYPLESETPLTDRVQTGDEVSIDLDSGKLTLLKDNSEANLKPLGVVAPVVEAGGIFAYARQSGMIGQAN